MGLVGSPNKRQLSGVGHCRLNDAKGRKDVAIARRWLSDSGITRLVVTRPPWVGSRHSNRDPNWLALNRRLPADGLKTAPGHRPASRGTLRSLQVNVQPATNRRSLSRDPAVANLLRKDQHRGQCLLRLLYDPRTITTRRPDALTEIAVRPSRPLEDFSYSLRRGCFTLGSRIRSRPHRPDALDKARQRGLDVGRHARLSPP